MHGSFGRKDDTFFGGWTERGRTGAAKISFMKFSRDRKIRLRVRNKSRRIGRGEEGERIEIEGEEEDDGGSRRGRQREEGATFTVK